jgi:hypothetical protein
MWQIDGFSLEVCVKLYYIDCAYPLNPNNNNRITMSNVKIERQRHAQ